MPKELNTMKQPLFTIITVTYNAASVLPITLRSVKEQSFTDYEYLVIDGASKDNSLDVIAEYNIPGIRVLSEPDHGIYDAMNKGVDLARGEYLIFLNAGDSFYNSDTLHVLADAAKRTHADILYGQTQIVDGSGKFVSMRHLTAPSRLSFSSFKRGMLVCHQAFVARRRIAPKYDLQYKFSADYEWCLRCLRQSKRNVYVGSTVINFLEGGTTAKNHRASLAERFRIMSRYYGLLPTLARHISFVPRYLLRSLRGGEK